MKFLPMLLVLILLLPTIAFAQLTTDIGELLFRDILKMTEYPGAPFSGNIINDIVMFLFIPTVFIIVIVYTLVGRLTPHPKLNLLMSLAFYAFIVFGGYYRIFALLAGPYFLFMLIIMGLVFFFLGHFGLRRGGLGGHAVGGGMSGSAVEAGSMTHYENMSRPELLLAKERVEAEIRDMGKQIHGAESHGESHVGELRTQMVALQRELFLIKHQLDLVGKAAKRLRYF